MESYSVLMSVYFREKPEYLSLSIQSMLAQTVPTDDFVLVCDGPLTPELDAVIDDFSAQYAPVFHVIRLEKNQGLAAALNAALPHCKNDLVARMDSDDFSAPDRCQRQLAAYEAMPDLQVLGGTIEEFEGSPEHVILAKPMPLTKEDILHYAKTRNPFNHPSVMFRKSAVLSAGGYPSNPLYEDYALWVKLMAGGANVANLPQTLCYMRVDDGIYKRRGGWRYFKTAASFRLMLRRTHFCSLSQCAFSIGTLAVACLVPERVRKQIYRRLLRKDVK